jgi:hypothetical protein
MAKLSELNAIAGKHDPRSKPQKGSALMQHSRGANEHHVEISERQGNGTRRPSQYAPRNVTGRAERIAHPSVNIRGPDNSALIEHQTDVMKSQGVAVNKQSQVLAQQTGLMHDQIRATKDVSQVVERLYEYMQKEGNKLNPKVQQSAKGNTYEGQFERIQEKQMAMQEQRQRRREISEDLRRQRSERARGMDRDERGRFQRGKKGLIPKIQDFGGRLGGAGGRLGGMGGGAGGLLRMAGPLLALATAFYGGKAMEAASDNYRYDVKNAGTVARGWQSTKDVVGDALGGIGGDQMAMMAQNPKFAGDIAGATKKGKEGGLGSVSAYFESGNRGVETVSTGKGDNGGVSYGTHQLSSKSGTMNAFLRSEEGSKYYNEFRGLKAGSKEFNEKYLDVVKNDKEGMEGAQKAFIKKTHFDPLSSWVNKQYGIDVNERSRAVQELMYSLSVQHGASGAQDIISQAFGNRDAASMSDKEIIDRIQKYRTYNVGSLFRSSSKETQVAMQERGWKETAALNNLLETENSGNGSVAGSNYKGMGSAMAGTGEFAAAQKSFGGKPNLMLASGNGGGGGGSSNGTVGVMAPGGGSASGASGNADEAGANAGVEYQDNGNFFNIGVKNVVPADSSVNLAGLNPKFQKAFFTMVGDWVTNFGGGTVTSASAFRTRAEQEALWVKYGRNTKRVARPGTSRHESGFAIDIDRNSAGKLEQSGMFKKYGFHRPLSNEPWHVEMVGAGKGGGGVSTSGSAPSPQVMQKAAEQELNKVGESQVVSAEEGTRQAVTKENAKAEAEVQSMQSAIAGGADPTTTGEPPAAGAGKEGEVSTTAQGGGAEKIDAANRTPEQQAMYEQYLKSSGGDPRKVPPDIFTNPAAYGLSAKDAEGQKVMKPGEPMPPMVTAGGLPPALNGMKTTPRPNDPDIFTNGAAYGLDGKPGQVALDVNGQPYEDLNYRGGKINTMATPGVQTGQIQSTAELFKNPQGGAAVQSGNPFGANPNGPVMGPNGVQKEPGLLDRFGIKPTIYQSGAGVGGGISGGVLGGINMNKGVRGKGSVSYTPPSVSGVLGSQGLGIPGMNGQIGGIIDGLTRGQKPGKDSMIDMAASAAIGGLFSMAQDRPKPMEPTVSPVQSFTSPASPSYYANEQPIVAKAATMAPASVMPVQTTTAPVEATRQAYDPVQSVNVVSAPPQESAPAVAGGPAAGSGAAGGGAGAGGGSDMPQLDEIPAMLDDYGLLFINSGYC